MAIGLDHLIDFLLSEIALCGVQGAGSAEFFSFIEKYHRQSHTDQSGHDHDESSPCVSAERLGRAYCERVWQWICTNPDIRVTHNMEICTYSLSEFEAAESLGSQQPTANLFNFVAAVNDNSSKAVHQPSDTLLSIREALKYRLKKEKYDLPGQADTTSSPLKLPPLEQHISSHMPVEVVEDLAIFDDLEQHVVKPRIHASQARTWQALTGHGIDLKKVPTMEFVLLSLIASRGSSGMTQPDLTAVSGQDKRSVPYRTNELARKGYIVKKPVQSGKIRTSLCVHSKFISQSHFLTSAAVEDVFQKGSFMLPGFVNLLWQKLKDAGIVPTREIRKRLGVPMKTWNKRATQGALIRLDQTGMIKRFSVRKKHAEDNWVTCIRVLRPPKDDDINNLGFRRKSHIDGSYGGLLDDDLNGDTIMRDLEIDMLDEGDAKDSQHPEPQSSLEDSPRIPPQWVPERFLANTIFDVIALGGFDGSDSEFIRDRVVGPFWRRPMESHLTRLTEHWEKTQPPNLRHLAIVRDSRNTKEKKFLHYVYRTFENFQKAVALGQVHWESVSKTVVSKKTKDAPNSGYEGIQGRTKHGTWGFGDVNRNDFVLNNGSGTLSETRLAIVHPRKYGSRWDTALTVEMGLERQDSILTTHSSIRKDGTVRGKKTGKSLLQQQILKISSSAKKAPPSISLSLDQRAALGLKPTGRLSKHVEDQILAHRMQTGDQTSIPDKIQLESSKIGATPLMTSAERIALGLPPRGRLGIAQENKIRAERGLAVLSPRSKNGDKKFVGEPALLTKEQRIAFGWKSHGRLPQALIDGLRQERKNDIPLEESTVIPEYMDFLKAKAEASNMRSTTPPNASLTVPVAAVGLYDADQIEFDDVRHGGGEPTSKVVLSLTSSLSDLSSSTSRNQHPYDSTTERSLRDVGQRSNEIPVNNDTSPQTEDDQHIVLNALPQSLSRNSLHSTMHQTLKTPAAKPAPATVLRYGSPETDITSLKTSDRTLYERYKYRSDPGIYFNQYARYKGGRGRPRKAFIATFKLDGLQDFQSANVHLSSPSNGSAHASVDGRKRSLTIALDLTPGSMRSFDAVALSHKQGQLELPREARKTPSYIGSVIDAGSSHDATPIATSQPIGCATILPRQTRNQESVLLSTVSSTLDHFEHVNIEDSQHIEDPFNLDAFVTSNDRKPSLDNGVTDNNSTLPMVGVSMGAHSSIIHEPGPLDDFAHLSNADSGPLDEPATFDRSLYDDHLTVENEPGPSIASRVANNNMETNAPTIPLTLTNTAPINHLTSPLQSNQPAENDYVSTQSGNKPDQSSTPHTSILTPSNLCADTISQSPNPVSQTENLQLNSIISIDTDFGVISEVPLTIPPKPKPRSKKDPVSTGSSALFRRKIIQEVIDLCGGVFPDGGEIGRPFHTLWVTRHGHITGLKEPISSTVISTARAMCKDPQSGLKQMGFFMKNKNNSLLSKRSMITYAHYTPSSPEVVALAHMMANYSSEKSHQYYPEQIRHLVDETSLYQPVPLAPKDESIVLSEISPAWKERNKKLQKRGASYVASTNADGATPESRIEAPQARSHVEQNSQFGTRRARLASLNDRAKRFGRTTFRPNFSTINSSAYTSQQVADDSSIDSDSSEDIPLIRLRPLMGTIRLESLTPEESEISETDSVSEEVSESGDSCSATLPQVKRGSSHTDPTVQTVPATSSESPRSRMDTQRTDDLIMKMTGTETRPILSNSSKKRGTSPEHTNEQSKKRLRLSPLDASSLNNERILLPVTKASDALNLEAKQKRNATDVFGQQATRPKKAQMRTKHRGIPDALPTLLERLTGLTGDPNDPIYQLPKHDFGNKQSRPSASRRNVEARKRETQRDYDEILDPVEHFRKVCYTLVVASCMSGSTGTVDWRIVRNVWSCDKFFDLSRVQRLWAWMKGNMDSQVTAATLDFQSSFLTAYKNRKVAAIEDIETYNWSHLVRWCLRKCTYLDCPLPLYYEALYQFSVDQTSSENLDRPTWYSENIPDIVRMQIQLHSPLAVPLHSARDTTPSQHDVVLRARSWIRANTATSQKIYHGQQAHDKLQPLGEGLISCVVGDLVKKNVLRMRKIKTLRPGRNYTFTTVFAKGYRRLLAPSDWMTTIATKNELDVGFSATVSGSCFYSISKCESNASIMTILDMLGGGTIRLVPQLPPVNNEIGESSLRLSVWGFHEGDYSHRLIDRSHYFWDLHAVPTGDYRFGSPLGGSVETPLSVANNNLGGWLPLPQPPLPGQFDPDALLPVWSSIDGHSITWPWWYRILNLILQPLLFQAGATAEDIFAHCSNHTTELFEVKLVLDWLESVRAVRKVAGAGYMTLPGFWAAFGDKLFDSDDDWFGEHVKTKAQRRAMQQEHEAYSLRSVS